MSGNFNLIQIQKDKEESRIRRAREQFYLCLRKAREGALSPADILGGHQVVNVSSYQKSNRFAGDPGYLSNSTETRIIDGLVQLIMWAGGPEKAGIDPNAFFALACIASAQGKEQKQDSYRRFVKSGEIKPI